MRKRSTAEKADISVGDAVAPGRNSLFVRAAGKASELADQPPLITICAITFAAGLILGNGRLARAGGRMLAAELLATEIKSAVKHRIDRTRPFVRANGGRYKAEKGHAHASALNSFPSGHTAGAVAVARAYAREYPERAATAYGIAAATGAIQIPRGKHYPSDVLAGLAVGLVAEAGVYLAERLIGRIAKHDKAKAGALEP
ncbi:phosphatase PAP2 family protein [Sphingomonas crusticola]|uniref:phosphatase PAP2 family protein n=1 Tax=Sphingomonas crusticola TaxID=1697973 RepID=UPI000E221A64|nr:phosphatase PAP2 family protein [Sphingomonas crusticola]